MKVRTLLAFLLVSVIAMAQAPVLNYYMPKTEVVVEVSYLKTELEPGMFYQYSERYLGVKDAIIEAMTMYEIESVRIFGRTVADKSRMHQVELTQKTLANMGLSLNDKGILEGVNCSAEHPQKKNGSKLEPKHKADNLSVTLPPLLEEQILSGSLQRMAESTAKQIYRIRENRFNLLFGETDHAQMDGGAMRLTLSELAKQEEQLTQLFVGKRKTELKRKMFVIDTDEYEPVLFRFSQYEGIVDSDDVSGKPYEIKVKNVKVSASHGEDKKVVCSPIYFISAGETTITITESDNLIAEKTLIMPQYGYETALPQELFLKSAPKIEFNVHTGAIRSIKQ